MIKNARKEEQGNKDMWNIQKLGLKQEKENNKRDIGQ